MNLFEFPPTTLPPETDILRREVRDFLNRELGERPMAEKARSWTGVDLPFTRKLAQQGWIGMALPKAYGGHERSMLERYVVVEELLAAGAPVAAYWAADRQTGPLLVKFGTETQKRTFLPKIAAGECFFCIGMSEPDSGSDLAAARTMATRTDDGYLINGSKIWTSGADRAHYMLIFCRTDTRSDDRHGGFSQLIVDMTSPGITVQPILDMSGRHLFNQVFLENVFVPQDMLVGEEGRGWKQVTNELSLERSGPDRFLSSFVLLVELVRELAARGGEREAEAIGRLVAHLHVLRRMSLSVAGMLQVGHEPALEASVVKDLGATLEQEIPEIARTLVDIESPQTTGNFILAYAQTMLISPAYSLRGGTREILRGMIARGLNLR